MFFLSFWFGCSGLDLESINHGDTDRVSRNPCSLPFDEAGPAKGFLQIGITQVEALKPRCLLINQRVNFFFHDASLTHGFYSFITAAIAYRRFAQSIRRSSTYLNDRFYRQQPFAAGTSDVSHADKDETALAVWALEASEAR